MEQISAGGWHAQSLRWAWFWLGGKTTTPFAGASGRTTRPAILPEKRAGTGTGELPEICIRSLACLLFNTGLVGSFVLTGSDFLGDLAA
jgi:hypothetical protein